ncbi:hypothetical protein LTS08_005057 [Lithohypha guttulata]|nr:hypothetical protein LTS08_005057 [Lithohypha guttulata]
MEETNGLTGSRIPAITTLPTHKVQQANLYSPSTLSIHADDPLNILTDVAPPIHVSTTFRYTTDPSQLRPFRPDSRPDNPLFPHQETPSEHCYSRLTTHSTSRLEAILTSLLHNPCITYTSGLSALHAVLVHLCPKRVSIGGGYHGCKGVLALHVRMNNMQVLPLDCPAEDLQKGDLVLLETPINPTGIAVDIAHYAQKAHSRGAYLMVDSTFAPPPLQDPFVHGADIVMHSGTKYIGGHSDMLCGVISVRKELAFPDGEGGKEGWMSRMLEDREFLGSVMGGLEGWLGVRSVRTLELRVMRQSESAAYLVQTLNDVLHESAGEIDILNTEDCQAIRKVLAKVQHASLQVEDIKSGWLKKQMPNGPGPVFAISMKSGDLARHLPSKLYLFHHATSLGGVESLIEWRTMTDSTVGSDLLRVSTGIEDAKDLLKDLVQGFRALIEEFKL